MKSIANYVAITGLYYIANLLSVKPLARLLQGSSFSYQWLAMWLELTETMHAASVHSD